MPARTEYAQKVPSLELKQNRQADWKNYRFRMSDHHVLSARNNESYKRV